MDNFGKMGCQTRLLKLLKNICSNVFIKYQICNLITKKIQLHKGVKQGCLVSMTLFSLVIYLLVKSADSMPASRTISGRRSDILADDLVVFARSGEDLAVRLLQLNNKASMVHLNFKSSKCGYFCFNSVYRIPEYIAREEIQVVDEHNSYKYLEVSFGSAQSHKMDDMLENVLTDCEHMVLLNPHSVQTCDRVRTFLYSRLPFTYELGK